MPLPMDLHANGLLRCLEEEGAVAYANRIPVGFQLTPVAVQPDWRFDLAHAEAIEAHCEGHFLLPSGKHTNVYIQVSLGLRYVGTSRASSSTSTCGKRGFSSRSTCSSGRPSGRSRS
jgi:hypothetical protein